MPKTVGEPRRCFRRIVRKHGLTQDEKMIPFRNGVNGWNT